MIQIVFTRINHWLLQFFVRLFENLIKIKVARIFSYASIFILNVFSNDHTYRLKVVRLFNNVSYTF